MLFLYVMHVLGEKNSNEISDAEHDRNLLSCVEWCGPS